MLTDSRWVGCTRRVNHDKDRLANRRKRQIQAKRPLNIFLVIVIRYGSHKIASTRTSTRTCYMQQMGTDHLQPFPASGQFSVLGLRLSRSPWSKSILPQLRTIIPKYYLHLRKLSPRGDGDQLLAGGSKSRPSLIMDNFLHPSTIIRFDLRPYSMCS